MSLSGRCACAVVAFAVALAGCASRPPTEAEIQMANLRSPSVQVGGPLPLQIFDPQPNNTAGIVGGLAGAIPGVGILGAMAIGGALGGLEGAGASERAQAAELAAQPYRAATDPSAIAHQMAAALRQRLARSPNFGQANYLPPAASPQAANPLQPEGPAAGIGLTLSVLPNETNLRLHASLRVGGGTPPALWLDQKYESIQSLNDLVNDPKLSPPTPGTWRPRIQAAALGLDERRALWLADDARLLQAGIHRAIEDLAEQMSWELGRPDNDASHP